MGNPGRRRVALLAAAAALTAPLVACSGDAVAYGEELADYAFEKAHIAKLPGGERLAVGSRTGHDVTVQWGDGDTWTAPATVLEDALWTHDLTLREREGTAAVSVDFWDERELDDDYAPDHSRILVCRDHACAAAQKPRQLSSAYVSDDGSLVSFGLDRRKVGFWEDGEFRTDTIDGPRVLAPRVTGDGSFVATAPRQVGDLCHYDLYLAPRGTADFSLAARGPGFPDGKPCTPYSPDLDDSDPDRVSVYIDSAVDRLEFVRKDGTWSAVIPEVPPLAFPDTGGARSVAPLQLDVAGGQVLVGSPDLKRIVAQVRRAGSETWERPRTIARAPRGMVCRWMAGEWSDEGSAMVNVYCYPEDLRWRPAEQQPATVGLVLATDDGEDWPMLTLQRPADGVRRAADHLLVTSATRSLLWRKGYDDLRVIELPSGAWDQLVVLDDERVLRLIGNPDPDAECRPAWTVARLDARAWPAPTPLPQRIQRRLGRGTCSFEAYEIEPGRLDAAVSGMAFEAHFGMVPTPAGLEID